MSCENHTTFSNVQSVSEPSLINLLEDNLKSFLDWGLLNIGAFVNVNIPTSGIYKNSQYHQLKPTSDPAFANNKIWQSQKKDWIWETGISYTGQIPNQISGVLINNTPYPAPTGSGEYGYNINYPMGQIVFDKSVSSANISLSYSYRWCQVYKASSSPWLQELQKMSLSNVDQFNQRNKGDFSIISANRIQMPCIILEPVARSNMTPWQLGSSTFMIDQDILCHIFTENVYDKNKLADIIRLQKHKTIWLYDSSQIIQDNVYGIKPNGSINNSGKIYPDIINDTKYRWLKCFFKDIEIIDMESLNNSLFWCTLRLTTEVIR